MCFNYKYDGDTSFLIKELEAVSKNLGLRVALDDFEEYILDQEVSINLLLKEFGLESANGVRTPFGDECNERAKDDCEFLPATDVNGKQSVKSFQSLVGSLLRIAKCTRPGISFAVHKTTRQKHNPTT
ncbi:unnamed protein product [Peronospora belbahrii]|uniref:Uncharacterized protein n=1 Tax=Peronospora belbahrii TaxID=622444 RepID=A0AAU9LJ33_9STRA|nr:unnamed protein product [Peronospora belbahrii]